MTARRPSVGMFRRDDEIVEAAQAYAATIDGYWSIFFDYAPGTGAFIESNTRRAQ